VLTSRGKRERCDASGPLFAGWEVGHLREARRPIVAEEIDGAERRATGAA